MIKKVQGMVETPKNSMDQLRKINCRRSTILSGCHLQSGGD
ncbi:unnamed protein product [Musa acuminata var. zebrina]